MLRSLVVTLLLASLFSFCAIVQATEIGTSKSGIDGKKPAPTQQEAADKKNLLDQARSPEKAEPTVEELLKNKADEGAKQSPPTSNPSTGGAVRTNRAPTNSFPTKNPEREADDARRANEGNPQKSADESQALGKADVSFLRKQVEELVARIEVLEKGILKAPLTVQGAGGKTILRLSADGYLLLGADGGNQIALVVQPGAAARIAVQGGNAAAQLSAGNGEAKVEVFNGSTQRVDLRASAAELGLVVQKNGQPAAGLSGTAAKGVALRIYDKGGKQIAAAGENPRTPGTGLIYVGNGSQNGAALAANVDGSGVVHAFATDGTVGAGLIGVERLVGAYSSSGAAVATMSKSEGSEGGNVTARNPAGEGVFRAGYRGDLGGGEACVYRAKRENTFCIGITAR